MNPSVVYESPKVKRNLVSGQVSLAAAVDAAASSGKAFQKCSIFDFCTAPD